MRAFLAVIMYTAIASIAPAQQPLVPKEVRKLLAPEVVGSTTTGGRATITQFTFSPDGSELFGGCGIAGVVWDVKSGRITALQGLSVGNPAYTKDGKKRLAFADVTDPKANLKVLGNGFVAWDAKAPGNNLGKELARAIVSMPKSLVGVPSENLEAGSPELLAFSPDGKTAVCTPVYRLMQKGKDTPSNFQLRVYDATRGVEVRGFALKHTARLVSLARSPDGKLVVSGSNDETARVWDVATGKELALFKGHASPVGAVVFSPDGLTVASAGQIFLGGAKNGKFGDYTICVWEAKTGKELARFEGHAAAVHSLAFVAEGKRVFSVSHEANGREGLLWDAVSGKEIGAMKLRSTAIAFGPDGLFATTGGPFEDGVIRVLQLP